MASQGKRAGRTAAFSVRQNRALRGALRALKRTRGLSQLAVGELLGIAQQNAGRLLNTETAGFSYDTAKRLVHELGFGGVDAFFVAKKLVSASTSSSSSTDRQARSA